MASNRIDLDADLQQAVTEVQTAILEAMAFATLCDRFSRLPMDTEPPPAGVVIQFEGSHVNLARGDFGPRGSAYAVVTMVGACEAFLKRLLLIAQVARKFSQRPTVRSLVSVFSH